MASAGDQGDAGSKRGAFIVLEGLDRSGKTTQVKLLEERLAKAGRPVKTMRFPGECALSTKQAPVIKDHVTRRS